MVEKLLTAIGSYLHKDDKYCANLDYSRKLPSRKYTTCYKKHRVFSTLEEAQKECKRKQDVYNIKCKYRELMEQELNEKVHI